MCNTMEILSRHIHMILEIEEMYILDDVSNNNIVRLAKQQKEKENFYDLTKRNSYKKN